AIPFEATDSRGIREVMAVRAGLTVLFSRELAIKSREAQRNNNSQTDFALIPGSDVIRQHAATSQVEQKSETPPTPCLRHRYGQLFPRPDSDYSMRTIAIIFACAMIPALASAGKRPKSTPTPTPAPTPVTVGVHGNEPLIAAAPDGTLYISALQHVYSSTDSG